MTSSSPQLMPEMIRGFFAFFSERAISSASSCWSFILIFKTGASALSDDAIAEPMLAISA